ncbi:MAG: hypothetical protein LBU48_07505, partial [Coriobacteriales bacterium]|nr:hypothetical protein [Coriobacteriales bacterium]
VILAVKPQMLRAVAEHLAATPGFEPQRVISIAAGITTQTLAAFFPDAAVIRVMPNTGLTVGAGMSVVSVAQGTPRAEGELVSELFSLMGEALLVDESLQNAATAISGSGPAYFALFVKELAAAGARAGLPADAALMLAQQTMLGTSRLFELTCQSPEQLMAAVTSPNGTTQAALAAFEAEGVTSIIQAAVTAAITRAEELA